MAISFYAMPDFAALVLFMSATLALNITPGPDMLYTIGRSVSQGRAAGVISALGISAGTMFHIAAVTLGLSAFLNAVPTAYMAIRIAGGVYLIYLGARALQSAGKESDEPAIKSASMSRIFAQGVITNVLNPKVALFFLAFLPQFTDPSKGHVGRQILILGLLFNLSGTIVNVLIAWFAGALTSRARESSTTTRWLQRITGTVFIGLGLRLITTARR